LIGAAGEKIGVVTLNEALKMAEAADLDLVEISPQGEPPVCRIMDYGKFLFKQSKQTKVKQKRVQIKEIKIRVNTDTNDYQVKLKSLIRFLENGDKAKVTLRFRGRELMHQELGLEVMHRLLKDLSFYGAPEQLPKLEGKQMGMVIAPNKKK
jgi:translation initiation factor IF-3